MTTGRINQVTVHTTHDLSHEDH